MLKYNILSNNFIAVSRQWGLSNHDLQAMCYMTLGICAVQSATFNALYPIICGLYEYVCLFSLCQSVSVSVSLQHFFQQCCKTPRLGRTLVSHPNYPQSPGVQRSYLPCTSHLRTLPYCILNLHQNGLLGLGVCTIYDTDSMRVAWCAIMLTITTFIVGSKVAVSS